MRNVGSGMPERMVVLCLEPSLHSMYSASCRMSFCRAMISMIFMIFLSLSSRLNLSISVGMVEVRIPTLLLLGLTGRRQRWTFRI
ncbi:hypothetical protein D3C80_1745070 [compost metagenome]